MDLRTEMSGKKDAPPFYTLKTLVFWRCRPDQVSSEQDPPPPDSHCCEPNESVKASTAAERYAQPAFQPDLCLRRLWRAFGFSRVRKALFKKTFKKVLLALICLLDQPCWPAFVFKVECTSGLYVRLLIFSVYNHSIVSQIYVEAAHTSATGLQNTEA